MFWHSAVNQVPGILYPFYTHHLREDLQPPQYTKQVPACPCYKVDKAEALRGSVICPGSRRH